MGEGRSQEGIQTGVGRREGGQNGTNKNRKPLKPSNAGG